MTLIRARQRAVTLPFPHNANKRVLVPKRGRKGGIVTPQVQPPPIKKGEKLMGFGGGSNQQSQSSATDTFGLSKTIADMFSVSGGQSSGQSQQGSSGSSFGSGTSESFGTSDSSGRTFVDPAQQAQFNKLYGAGSSLMNSQGNMQQVAQGIVNPLMAQGKGAMKTLTGLQDVSGMVNAQTAGLQSGLSRLGALTNRDIGDKASGMGAFGGSRHGIAEGVAEGETNRAFQEGYGDIVSAARGQAANAAGMAGNLAPILANLGMMPSQAAWNPLQQMKGLLGGPTVLSTQQASSQQQSSAQNLSRSLQESFGWSKQQADNFARAQSSTRSTSLNLGKTRAEGQGSGYNANVSLFNP